MNALDILKYGHLEVQKAFKDLSKDKWNEVGVTTHWSLKDMLAHLASYENLLVDALNFVVNPKALTPFLDKMNADKQGFNDSQVASRKDKIPTELMQEYNDAYRQVQKLAAQLSPEKLRESGTIPWYGLEYSLDDFIVYASYAHKREHSGQIHVFRKRLAI